MARILMEGFEDVDSGTPSSNLTAGQDCTGFISSTGVHEHSYTADIGGVACTYHSNGALLVGYASGGGGLSRPYWTMYDTASTTDHYFSFDFRTRFGLHTQANTRSIFDWNYSATSGQYCFKIMLVPLSYYFGSVLTYRLDIMKSDGTTVGTGTTTLDATTWYQIEGFFDYVANASQLTLKINGVVEHNALVVGTTGKDKTHTVILGPESPTNFANFQCYFDNLRINDSSGTTHNTWPGIGYIANLRPNAAALSNEWRTSAGGAGSSSNYTLVNEIPINSANYVCKTTSLASSELAEGVLTGTVDEYNVDSPLDMGIPNTAEVNCIGVAMINGATGATSTVNRYGVARILAAQGLSAWTTLSTENEAVGRTTTGMDWSQNARSANYDENNTRLAGTNPSMPSLICSFAGPNSPTRAWTFNDLLSLCIGVRAYNTNAAEIRCEEIWAVVDWKPGTGSTRLGKMLTLCGVGV